MITKPSYYEEENSGNRNEHSISMSQKSAKNNYEEEAQFDANSYDIDPKCKILIFSHGRYIRLVST